MPSSTRALSLQQWLHQLLLACGGQPGEDSGYRLRWARPQTGPAYIYDLNPALPLAQRFALANNLISRWQSLELPATPPLLLQIKTHTQLHPLPSGQLTLTPDAIALAAWLTWFRHSQGLSPWPVRPAPDLVLAPTSLAARLQLSPWMAIHYIQSRCHHLARLMDTKAAQPESKLPPTPLEDRGEDLKDLVPRTKAGQRVLGGIVHLVDGLVDVRVEGEGTRFKLAYNLATEVDS